MVLLCQRLADGRTLARLPTETWIRLAPLLAVRCPGDAIIAFRFVGVLAFRQMARREITATINLVLSRANRGV